MNAELKISDIELCEKEDTPDSWTIDEYRRVLEEIDYEDPYSIADGEVYEMLLMALDEAGFDEAAKAVFKTVVKGGMTEGQIDNSIHKLADERLWESYAEFSLHSQIYKVAWLVHKAFQGSCCKPEYVKLTCKVSGNEESLALVEKGLTKRAFLRLAASGMDESFIISRLFEKQVKGGSFPEAEAIIWKLSSSREGSEIKVEAISSHFWFSDFEDVESIDCTVNEKDL